MATEPKTVRVTDTTALLDILDDAAHETLLLDRGGTIFRLSREEDNDDIAYEPEPERVRETLAATAGTWADLDVDQVIEDLYEARRAGSRPVDTH